MRVSRYAGHFRFGVLACWIVSIYLTYNYASNSLHEKQPLQLSRHSSHIRKANSVYEYPVPEKTSSYSKDMPLIFVGGMPRSGTTLMRAMLDAHPSIRCGQETRVIPRILGMRASWLKSRKEQTRLDEAGVTKEVIDAALSQFILEIIVKHGHPAKFYCNKDPFTLKSLRYILMLRDGRATAHSIITRHVTISGFDITSYRDVLTKWNRAIEAMYAQCTDVGDQICLPVHYEQLVLQPMSETKRIFDFLNIPYDTAVLHHEKHMSNISLSSVEKSTDQVQRPLYLDSLNSWFGKIPNDVVRDMAKIAPMLKRIGYDPFDQTPKYGEPDELVLNKTKQAFNGRR